MTRKRLKKLIMSYGYQRNEAERMVWDANKAYTSYDQYYSDHHFGFVLKKIGIKLRASFKGVKKGFEVATNAMKNALAWIMETVR